MSDKKRPAHRPLKDFDWELLGKILQFKPSLSDTSEIMNVSEDTVENRIKEKYGITFSEYRSKKMSNVRLTLVQKAIQMAKAGDRTMLIFCLKNYCGWADRNEDDENRPAININYSVVRDLAQKICDKK